MPPQARPSTSGYARIAQADEEDAYFDDSDGENPHKTPRTISTASAPRFAPLQSQPRSHLYAEMNDPYSSHQRRPSFNKRRRRRSSSGVDIKAINARFERWAEEIASKFKIHKSHHKSADDEIYEIKHSVFQPPDGLRPLTAEEAAKPSASNPHAERMTKVEFDDVVESVRVAIELGVHPKMISQGSSGSYFARNTEGKVVGVFKPKDEEPYASRNPKWTKWIHRNLFPCFFGRACLIPNLSYVSEAAAYVLDSRLQTNIVPYTGIVWLSSKSFHHDFWDRSAYYRKSKPLPAKVGSFQVFLKGFKDANLFLRDNPWPDQNKSTYAGDSVPKKKRWTNTCRPDAAGSDDEAEIERSRSRSRGRRDRADQPFVWTDRLKQSFREELEKLVILDYIMRNTDRGLDNWMVRVDTETEKVSVVSEPPQLNGNAVNGTAQGKGRSANASVSPYRRQEHMSFQNRSESPSDDEEEEASISIGAIDNSLSWPWKHPDAWRSFPFGWLFLPVSLIGQPFSRKTRDHFLPLLTSSLWWSETQLALRKVFSQDSDFQEKMFARQIAVMKGQAWNVVETLKTPDHGPLELTRRTRVCVWDDLVDIPVAIPMRVPSAEMRRRQEHLASETAEEEEMDISNAIATSSSSKPQADLLGSPQGDPPNPNRFDLSRNTSSSDLRRSLSPATIDGPIIDQRVSLDQTKELRMSQDRPSPARARTRASYEQRGRNSHARGRLSLTQNYGSLFHDDEDDLEGDLGYSAAEGMEGNHRKVIVERLEAVKSRNPVFSWC